MAAPDTAVRVVPQDTAAAALDTAGKRTAIATGYLVTTGAGNEADFGSIDISGGAANSGVLTALWKVTNAQGNTLVDNARLWLATAPGWDQAASVVKVQPLSGDDEAAPANTENYIVNGVVGNYTWATMDEGADPGQNMWSCGTDDTQTSHDITTPGTTDDVYMWAWYCAIAASETLGTYQGVVSGLELQFSFKYEYS